MGDLVKFENPMFGALTVIMRDGDPWFIGKEVSEILGYSNVNKAVQSHCKKSQSQNGNEFKQYGQRGVILIPESDVYRLIIRSRLPAAERFEEWVMEDVLPGIRKNGSYQVQPSWLENLSPQAKLAIEDLSNQLTEQKEETKRLNHVCNIMSDQFAEGTTPPKFAKQLNGVNTQKVNAYLINKKMIYMDCHGYMPTAYARDNYLTVATREVENKKTGEKMVKSEVQLTKKGAKWLYSKYLAGELPMKINWNGEYTQAKF